MNLSRHNLRCVLRWRVKYCRIFSTDQEIPNCAHNLSKCFTINENIAHRICMKHPSIKKLDEFSLKQFIYTVRSLGLPDRILIEQPSLFGLLPITIKYRYQVLKECGIDNIGSILISSYLPIVKQKTIGHLKKEGLIPSHINVENNLASYMTQWPTSLTTSIWQDVNETTLYSLRLKIIQRYLELVLDLTLEEFGRGLKTYPTLKHRPLQLINKTLDILNSKVMMPIHKIKSNFYLIHADPENLTKIIHNFRSVGGIDIKEVIRMHPKIAMKNYDTLVATRQILQEYEISDDAQRRCFEIYTLGTKTIKERLEKAKTIPEFKTFLNHPRFLKMIHYNTTAMKRLNKLYSNNKKCLSLNILSGSSAHYETFERAPGDRLGKGKDLLFCISQSLGSAYSNSDIRTYIKRHPFWINIPLVQVKYVYEKLSHDFTPNDIYENCPLLLYPWNKIKEVLQLFDSEKKIQRSFENVDFKNLSKSQTLSLALYELEKNHYFSGNGVWTEEKPKNGIILDLRNEKLNSSASL